ncbi:MAG: lysine biosynthesis protein LysX [Clostridia bacterium]
MDNSVSLICSRVRVEEKMLLAAFEKRGVEVRRYDERDLVLDLQRAEESDISRSDLAFLRAIAHSRAVALSEILESWDIETVNSHRTIAMTGDKLSTTAALVRAGVPCPAVRVAFDGPAALRAAEGMGYPVVFKPVVGSWGRLISRANDRDAAEALIEHKVVLGSPSHGVFYVQQYVDKPGRDIRVFTIGGEPVAAIYRYSDHWVTNTARGAKVRVCPLYPEMVDVCRRASLAVGGGLLAVDLLESDGELLVNEINHTMEFRNSVGPTGVDIPGLMVDYVISQVEARDSR